jgi:hypothetical protein
MDTTVLYKLVCLAIAVGTFYGWNFRWNCQQKPFTTINPAINKDSIRGAIIASTGIMTLLGLNQWGLWGLSVLACPFLGFAFHSFTTDWAMRPIEWAMNRRGIDADVFVKKDGDSIMAWPMTRRAKRVFRPPFLTIGCDKRGALLIRNQDYGILTSHCEGQGLVLAKHPNMAKM